MWLITAIGFFSIVQKSTDKANNTLTVRARVRKDLEALRQHYLPGLGDIQESSANDYRFRATAPRTEVAHAMFDMAEALNYNNFKAEVAKMQGHKRASLYHDVWENLCQLQTGNWNEPVRHPRVDDGGKPVLLKSPSMPTVLSTWEQANQAACVVPDGAMPESLNGVVFSLWEDAPTEPSGWEALANECSIEEPAFTPSTGKKAAAGVVIAEPDGRFWVVAPSNGFGGYPATFPKGTADGKSLQATALVEAFEESGLRVRLVRHLIDVQRSTSHTRYYLAERIGGHPGAMGWESQAVMLVPRQLLPQLLTNKNDAPILKVLNA